MCKLSLEMMLTKRLLLIKMKKIHLVFTAAFFLYCLMYFLSRTKNGNREISSNRLPSYEIHVFYDGGFRNKKLDGEYKGWFHYDTKVERKIETAYYPSVGLYSSNDAIVIDMHMRQILSAGIGVVVVSWWPPHHEKAPPMELILQYAQKYDLKVSIHLQNYPNRTISNIRTQLHLFFKLYGKHPALYKTRVIRKSRTLPIIYLQDSNLIPFPHWNALLGYTSNFTIRGTMSDAIYIGLLVDELDKISIQNSGFDGFYTFLSFRNYTFGSTWYNWPYIQDFAREKELVFIPTVSPGYDDRTLSSAHPYIARNDGTYYIAAWARAVISRSKYVAINSFNGWLHGTQIEPAQPNTAHANNENVSFDDYGPEGPHKYLALTRAWAIEHVNRSELRIA